MTPPCVFVLAGGTGGHVYPALALALTLRERGYQPRWVGTRRGLEARIVPAAGLPLHTLPMRGLRGKTILDQLRALGLLGISLLLALGLVLRYRPRVVVGLGGYASVPAAVAARCLWRPLLLQEQNAVAGSANRFLSRFAQRIATGFPGVLTEHPATRFIGNPVRDDLIEVADRSPWSWRGERALRVLILGGSLGARPLNEAIPPVAERLAESCIWMHQCGPQHLDEVRAAWSRYPRVDCDLRPFIEDMAEAYAWADLVICRAGALTVAELAVAGRPSVLVPLPHAIDDHQRANASFLADAGAGVLLAQDQLESKLEEQLRSFLGEPSALAAMAAAALSCARPRATQELADLTEGLLS